MTHTKRPNPGFRRRKFGDMFAELLLDLGGQICTITFVNGVVEANPVVVGNNIGSR